LTDFPDGLGGLALYVLATVGVTAQRLHQRRLLESRPSVQVARLHQPKEIVVPPAKKAAPAAKKSAAPPKAAPQATVTLKHLAAALSDSHDVPKKQAEAVLGDLVALTTRHLKKGDKIRLNGLGILQVRKRAARMGRNPATGESIKIKASKKIAFRPAKELKESGPVMPSMAEVTDIIPASVAGIHAFWRNYHQPSYGRGRSRTRGRRLSESLTTDCRGVGG
jgi:DNA-binding protein HU-beta